MEFSAKSAIFYRILHDSDKILYFSQVQDEGEDAAYEHFSIKYASDVVMLYPYEEQELIINFYKFQGVSKHRRKINYAYLEIEHAYGIDFYITTDNYKDISNFLLKSYEAGSLLVSDPIKQKILYRNKKNASFLNKKYIACFTKINEQEVYLCYN